MSHQRKPGPTSDPGPVTVRVICTGRGTHRRTPLYDVEDPRSCPAGAQMFWPAEGMPSSPVSGLPVLAKHAPAEREPTFRLACPRCHRDLRLHRSRLLEAVRALSTVTAPGKPVTFDVSRVL